MGITDTAINTAITLQQAERLQQQFVLFRHQQALALQWLRQELQELQALQAGGKPM